MKTIKIKTPAKINLTLEIINKRPDGFHNIQSIMQAVSLFDHISISIEDSSQNEITIKGNSDEIPYNSDNLAYKAAELLLEKAQISNKKVIIDIEKNIPVAAGLAGGSSNAAGVLKGLNEVLGSPVGLKEIDKLASKLGSDVNFCLYGGICLATSRGEELRKVCSIPYLNIAIVKPKNLGISAKEAYTKYSQMLKKPNIKNSDKMLVSIAQNDVNKVVELINNDLETAVINDYKEIKYIKSKLIELGCKNAMMSGSGPSVFGVYEGDLDLSVFESDYDLFKVNSINHGVKTFNE